MDKTVSLFPLSEAQKEAWFAQALIGEKENNSSAEVMYIDGNLDERKFVEAIDLVSQEVDVLKIRFKQRGSDILQWIDSSARIECDIVDLGGQPDHKSSISHWIANDLSENANLLSSKIFSTVLFAISSRKHAWCIRPHHVIMDGFAGMLYVQRVAEVYTALVNKTCPPPSPFAPFHELLTSEERYRSSEQFRRDREFWVAEMSEPPNAVTLATRRATQSSRFIRENIELSRLVEARLRELGRKSGSDLSAVMFTAVAIYLHRILRVNDIVIGVPLHARVGRILRSIPATIANVVPLRIKVVAQQRISDMVGSVGRTMRRIMRHQRYRSGELRRDLDLVAKREELFRVVVDYSPFNYKLNFGGCPGTVEGLLNGSIEDLSFEIYDRQDGSPIHIELQFHERLYSPAEARAHSTRFVRLLESICADTEQEVGELELMSSAEREQVLYGWNDTAQEIPSGTVVELFEQQVEKSPEAVAVVYEERSLTYAELNAEANRLADLLRERGVGPEVIVGICIERSLEMVVGLLAILKAGGAYLPLDPSYPEQRLQFMVEDAWPVCVVTAGGAGEKLPAGTALLELDGEETQRKLQKQSAKNPERSEIGLLAKHPAYVIYTSGSTGKPKGVVVSHGGLSNRLVWMQAEYELCAKDRVLQKTPFGFDVSVWEFFWPLYMGATLVVAKPSGHRDPEYLARLINESEITTVHFVPSMLHEFLQTRAAVECRHLRRVICSGEALSIDLQKRLQSKLSCSLFNLYGPTEATVDVTAWNCLGETGAGESIPIGSPIWNTQMYVLDGRMSPVPVGVAGELYIAGAGLARGYLNRPKLTSERFIANPYGEPGSRMYRSGDLARWKSDGNLEFIGRADEQVKIRGFRIELGEIEARLLEQEGVSQCAVVVREDVTGDKRLVAYVVAEDGVEVEAAKLRSELSRTLAEHMVPSAFVRMERMPLTANGKFDRKALPVPDQSAVVRRGYEAPEGEVERAIAQIWEELLGVERVGRQDHFFELGGHSLLAVQLMPRLEAATGKLLPVRSIFEAVTLAELAVAVEEAAVSGRRDPILPVDRTAHLPLSFAEQRVLSVEVSTPRAEVLNSSRIFIVSGLIKPEWLEHAFQTMVDRHEILRTHYTIDAQTGSFTPVIDPPNRFRLTVRDVIGSDQDGQRLAQAEARNWPDCFKGPLFRATLFIQAADKAILVVGIHHIVIDAVSTAVLLEELVKAYGALVRGESPGLAPLSLQYRDYAAWERMHLTPERITLLQQFWRERLAGAPVCVNLPFDRPRPVVLSDRAGRIHHLFSPELGQSIKRTAALHNVTPFIVLETMLAILCGQLARSRDVMIGTVTAGRRHPAMKNMVGLFVNTIPLRHAVQPGASVLSHLTAASQELASTLDGSELSFADIVAAVNPPRSSLHDPLFQVFCQLQEGRGRVDLAGLSLEAVPVQEGGRGADLAVVFQYTDQVLEAQVSYSVDLFDGQTVEALVALYVALVSRAMECPTASVEEVWAESVQQMREAPLGAVIERLIDQPEATTGAWYPLSSAQQPLWFEEQASPSGTDFSSLAVMHCPPAVDRDRLEAATRAHLVQDQSCWLRWMDVGRGLQGQALKPTTSFARFSVPAPKTDEDELEAILAWHRAPRDEATDNSEIAIFESPAGVIVATRSHHLLHDGWAAVRFFERITKNYALLEKDPAYRFEMDRRFLETLRSDQLYGWSEEYREDESFWRSWQKTDGEPLVMRLADRPDAIEAAPQVSSLRRECRPGLLEKLAHAAETLSLSLAELLTALTGLYLTRVSGEDTIVFAVPFLNRTKETLDIPGQFAKIVPLRLSFNSLDSSLAGVLQEAGEAFRTVLRHGRYPYGDLVRHCRFEPRHAHVSVNTLLLRRGIDIGGEPAHVQWLSGPEKGLSFLFTQFGRTAPLEFEVRFNGALFEPATVSRHADRLLEFIERVCSDLGAPSSGVSLLSAEERRLVIEEFNRTAVVRPREKLIQELFEEQAGKNPEAQAVVYEDRSLTYGELNRKANQLAHLLIERGVGPETIVGICMERSLEMMVGLLGILKAGGAYLPLDPGYPEARLRFIVEDAKPVYVLSSGRASESLPAEISLLHLEEAEVRQALEQQPESNPQQTGLKPEHPAYVIYTSGSTGTPKGVVVGHSNVVRLLGATEERFHFNDQDTWTLFHSYAFDFSVWEIWGALLGGGRLVIVPHWISRSPQEFLKLLVENQVTVLNQTPSAFYQLMRAFRADRESSKKLLLRLVIFGGEALEAKRLESWYEEHADTKPQLVNMYGITETTVHVSYKQLSHKDMQGNTGNVIGCGLPDLQVYLLEKRLEPVPVGVVGELYIAGAGLARGYLNRAELTAERFMANPYGEAGSRMYRSGDLARWRSDGNLEFIGRADEQVKIRGFRIELGEIEARLLEQEEVNQCAVVVREDVSGDQCLVAYVVTGEGVELDIAGLRAALSRNLPEYMIPSAYAHLECLPLTANGKLDRRALPAPQRKSREYLKPEGQIEEQIAQVYSEVLGVERVGREDHFFEMGGNSLSAVRVISQLRQRMGMELPLRVLFESPTVAGLGERVEELRGTTEIRPGLGKQTRPEVLPLSYAQERLWVLEQLGVPAGAYMIGAALRLEGELDGKALDQSLRRIIERHESLRTRFGSKEGVPYQIIDEPWALSLEAEDLSNLAEDEREAEVRKLAATELSRPFDLEHGPLLRMRLLRLGTSEHVLLVSMHHIISDGWSMGVLIEEVGQLYRGYVSGGEVELSPLQVQYADYALWQRDWLQGEELKRQREYWQEQLQGVPGALDLPRDHARPRQQSFRGGHLPIGITKELSEGLERLGRREGATLYMVLLAAYQLLLSRWSGQTDVVVGSPIANRTEAASERLIGFFVNTLAIRAEVRGESSFRELLSQVRERTLGAYGHQDLPFEQVVELLSPERDLSRQPVFQVMFGLQNTPKVELELSGLKLSGIEQELGTAKFDLTLSLEETEAGLRGYLEYARDLFKAETMARFLEQYQRVLEAIVEDAEQPVGAINLLSAAEREQVLYGWNQTGVSLPERTVVELFEQQVEKRPEAEAVIYEDRSLTYGELNRRANQLAHLLIERGVGPETIVGICMERSLEMIVGLLGIVKTGGAYLPLDPAYPQERLRFMIEDARPVCVLTAGQIADSLAQESSLLNLDKAEVRRALELQPESNPQQTGLKPEHPAYVIYTSGSTGRPKGVVIQHRGITNLVVETTYIEITAKDVIAQGSSVSFDAATFEIWGCLLNGALLVLVPQEVLLVVEKFRDLLRAQRITILWLTARLFDQYAELLKGALTGLKYLLVGGDVVNPRVIASEFRSEFPEHLLNGYGPSETTTFASTYEICCAMASGNPIPIGRPIKDTKICILDGRMQPVPMGVVGELYIAGAGLARGYLNRAELTAERFIANPYGEPGSRMYRSGDLARWRADGNLEFVGRADDQVKIRGFRIELGEIETRLLEQEEIGHCVVVMREDVAGDKGLVAYLVAGQGEEIDVSRLRASLRQILPEYMIPAAFVMLDELPLTPNGKLDRRALPAPEWKSREYEPAIGEIEALMAETFAQVLQLDHVGRHDNFFELGGHSLLATHLVSQLRERLQIKMPLRLLFEAPTVAGLVQAIGNVESSVGQENLIFFKTLAEIDNLSEKEVEALLWEINGKKST